LSDVKNLFWLKVHLQIVLKGKGNSAEIFKGKCGKSKGGTKLL